MIVILFFDVTHTFQVLLVSTRILTYLHTSDTGKNAFMYGKSIVTDKISCQKFHIVFVHLLLLLLLLQFCITKADATNWKLFET